MPRVCQITGVKTASGNNVSHAINRTRRKFYVNLAYVSFYSQTLGEKVRLRVSQRGRRTVEFKGGLDAYLQKTPKCALHPRLRTLKRRLEEKTAEEKAKP